MPIERAFYTVAEAAQELGLTPTTVRRAIMRGALQAEKLGARLSIIAPVEVERYRREHLGKQGWEKRRAADYTPSPMAAWARNYRARRQAAVPPPAYPNQGADHDPTP